MLHPTLNNLAYFLGASLSSFALFLSSTFPQLPLFQYPPSSPSQPHFLSFSQTELLLTTRCNFQFAESFLVWDQRGVTLVNSPPGEFSHCVWRRNVTEPPTACNSGQSEHLAALYDLNFQLFGGSESSATNHRQEVGSQEAVNSTQH